jgi:hypothetical protein
MTSPDKAKNKFIKDKNQTIINGAGSYSDQMKGFITVHANHNIH